MYIGVGVGIKKKKKVYARIYLKARAEFIRLHNEKKYRIKTEIPDPIP